MPGCQNQSILTADFADAADRTPPLVRADQPDIKSMTQHPVTGQIAYTRAERPDWWTRRIRFVSPEDACAIDAEQFYKVRWNLPRTDGQPAAMPQK
jgi:hypothetical protein